MSDKPWEERFEQELVDGAAELKADTTKPRYPDTRSWFAGVCCACGYNVVVTQPDSIRHPCADYWYYCSNKKCKNHEPGEHAIDQDEVSWVNLNVLPWNTKKEKANG